MADIEAVENMLSEWTVLFPHQIVLDAGGKVVGIWHKQLAVFTNKQLEQGAHAYLNELSSGFPTIGGLVTVIRRQVLERLPDVNTAFNEIMQKASYAHTPAYYPPEYLASRPDLEAQHRWSHPAVSFAMEFFGGPTRFSQADPARYDTLFAQFSKSFDAAMKRYLKEYRDYTPKPLLVTEQTYLLAAPGKVPTEPEQAKCEFARIRERFDKPAEESVAAPEAPAPLFLSMQQRLDRIEAWRKAGQITDEEADRLREATVTYATVVPKA